MIVTIIRQSQRHPALKMASKRALNHADIVIGHNIKFDLTWARECGFVYDGKVYDTMVGEYILAKAQRWPLGLAALAEKYDVTKRRKTLLRRILRRATRSTTSRGTSYENME